MRSNLRILVAAAAALLVAPVAMAESVEEQLKLMNERMQQLENQLDATQDELDASKSEVDRQQEVMEKAGLERQAKSGLSAFYQNVEISGHIAGSWFWNFNDPGDGVLLDQGDWPDTTSGSANGGFNGAFYPFHPDHNSFNLDQLWFTLHKPATEESRAGFQAEIVFGRTAGILNGAEADKCGQDPWRDCASEINLFTAFIEYQTPWGPMVKVGKMPTWIGYETPNTTQNFNITRGNVWTLLQPINHTGVAIEGDINGFVYGIAAVNDWSWMNPDNNNDKHLMAKVGYGTEMFSGKLAFLWGSESGFFDGDVASTTDVGTVNALLTVDPTEAFSAWLDFTYKWAGAGNPQAWGVALAGRYGFTERLGFALRGEFVRSQGGGSIGDDLRTALPQSITIGNSRDADIWGITGTFDYLVTDNLTLRAEVRYDYIDSNPSARCFDYDNTVGGGGCSNQFTQNDDDQTNGLDDPAETFTRRSQVTTGLELVYQF